MRVVADKLVGLMLMKFTLYLQYKYLIQASKPYDSASILKNFELHIHG